MTVEERFERLESFLSMWMEQSKNEHQENRRLWREVTEEIRQHAKETDEKIRKQAEETDGRIEQHAKLLRAEMAARDKVTDERIGKLVTAIADLIRSK
jgi:hypothetical protein